MDDKISLAIGNEPIPAPNLKGVKGFKKAPGKPKRAIELEFKPYTYAPVLNIFPFRAPDITHSFEFDGSGLLHMAIDGAQLISNVSAHKYPGLYPSIDIVDGFTRLSHAMLSKKLTYACSTHVSSNHYDDFKTIKNGELLAPHFLKLLCEGFGNFEHDAVMYSPRHIPLHQFNHFAYATGSFGQDGFVKGYDDSFFVNVHMIDWFKQVRDRSARLVDEWCTDPGNRINVSLNGVNYLTNPPTAVGMNPFPDSWSVDLATMGTVPPPIVKAHARLVSEIDKNRFAEGVMPSDSDLQYFRDCGYWILNWNTHVISRRFAWYKANVEMRFSALWRTAFVLETVKTMEPLGAAWQLMSVSEDTMLGVSAFSLPLAQQMTAYMLTRGDPKVKIEPDQFRIGVSDKSPRTARVEAIRRAAVTKEFV